MNYFLQNVKHHFITITEHRHQVIKNCIRAGIPLQGLIHDLSKYSPCEFLNGVRFYTGIKSPNEGEREKYGYSKAWMHHKGRNRHHFEYWTDYNIQTKQMSPVKMPLKYVIEMFCDRVAACKIYKKEAYTDAAAFEYFDRARNRIPMHPETQAFLEKLLVMLKENGEKKTFSYIRKYKLFHRDY